VQRESPDVAATDVRMPPTHSNERLLAALRIRAEHPLPGVIFVKLGLLPAADDHRRLHAALTYLHGS